MAQTFHQSVALFRQGQTDEVRAGCELILKMDVPEVELKDVDIRLENYTMTVKGERKFENLADSALLTFLVAGPAGVV